MTYAGNNQAGQDTSTANQHAVVKKDRSDRAVTTSGNIRGMEQTTRLGDGAVVVHGRISGRGSVEAEHVIIEGELSPGDSPGCINFGGNLTFSSTATLLIEIGGTLECSEYDRLDVANTLTINGATLQLVLINGFVPDFRQRYDVLDWGAISGSFASIDASAAVLTFPLQWDTSQLYATGELVVGVLNIADGDLAPFDNPDGIIDAADVMIAARLALNQHTAGPLQYAHGDMNADDVIDEVDLMLIQQLVIQN